MSNPHDQKKLLESRRKADDNYRMMETTLADARITLCKANFENTTTAKIERRQKTELMNKLKDERDTDVYYRRNELAALYNVELEDWKQEVLSKVETIDERKARIMKQAHALRDDREQKRNQYVQSMYKQQWRDGNDESRSLNSESMTKFMGEQRKLQMKEKIVRNAQAGEDENDFLKEWQRQLDVIGAKDKAKLDRAHNANMSTAKGLKDQIQYNENQKQMMYEMTQTGDEAEIRTIKQAIADEKAKQRQKQIDAHESGKAVIEFNATYKEIDEEKARVQVEQDAILLDYALEKERSEIAAEEEKRRAGADAAKQYTKYLQMMMIKEAEDSSLVDEMNIREFEKVQKARDDALQAREDARNHLMKLVKEGRKEQIAYKQKHDIEELEADRIYASKFAGDIAEGTRTDKLAVTMRRTKAEQNNVKLMAQIDARDNAAMLAKQDEYLEVKRMKHIETQHKARLNMQGGSVRLDYKRRTKD
jgi:hypothetical protein